MSGVRAFGDDHPRGSVSFFVRCFDCGIASARRHGAGGVPRRFLGNYPFAELQLLAWQLAELAPPKRRPGAVDFDVDGQGQMRDHATYAVGETVWVAETPQAAVRLETSDPGVDRGRLSHIGDVPEFR